MPKISSYVERIDKNLTVFEPIRSDSAVTAFSLTRSYDKLSDSPYHQVQPGIIGDENDRSTSLKKVRSAQIERLLLGTLTNINGVNDRYVRSRYLNSHAQSRD